MSGRVGNVVASRNKGGQYFYEPGDANPNPATTEQEAIRNAMSQCWTSWAALSSDQRALWELYSLRNPRANRIGLPHPVGGRAEFTRANILAFQINNLGLADLGAINDPPPAGAIPNQIEQPAPEIIYNSKTVTIYYASDAHWQADSGYLAVYVSPWLPSTVNYYRSPMTLAYVAVGPDGLDGATFNHPDNVNAPHGVHLTVICRAVLGGMLAPPQILRSNTTA